MGVFGSLRRENSLWRPSLYSNETLLYWIVLFVAHGRGPKSELRKYVPSSYFQIALNFVVHFCLFLVIVITQVIFRRQKKTIFYKIKLNLERETS